IIGARVASVQEDGAYAGFGKHAFELVRAVGGVYVHQHDARPRGPILQQHPFGTIRRPDPDTVARLQSQTGEAPGYPRRLVVELPPGKMDLLVADDQGLAIGESPGCGGEGLRDRKVKQRGVGTLGVAHANYPARLAPSLLCALGELMERTSPRDLPASVV